MATTDARPGFRLPWSADRTESEAADQSGSTPTVEDSGAADAAPVAEPAPGAAVDPWGMTTATESQPAPVAEDESRAEAAVEPSPAPQAAVDPWGGTLPATPAAPQAPKRKPNKLMADLTRAMQTAAEAARNETLERLQADAKACIEGIHTRSGEEAAELRKRADDDIAGIREWSKAEIARIREETEQRISTRKTDLEEEIEAHAARIERRIERVQSRVAEFEAEMAAFFEKLLAEDDPTHLAAMAENLPEPPQFDEDGSDLPPAEASASPIAVATPAAEPPAPEFAAEAASETPVEAAVAEPAPEPEEPVDTEAAFAAIQAAAEAAEAAEREAVPSSESTGVKAPEAEAPAEGEAGADDPRLAALGLSPEAAAEAEAEAEAGVHDAEELATFSDDALAARLAGLVPPEDDAHRAPAHTTRVVVTGLVSVASIAGFKRQLGRLTGVSSVGVSSGPDGEFIFAVSHGEDVVLADAIPSLSEFAPQVTGVDGDTITVAAHDPETDA